MKKAELREHTVADLKDMARGFEIPGFSTMNKDELVDVVHKALKKADKALARAQKDAAKETKVAAKPKPKAEKKTKPPKEQFAHESVEDWGALFQVTNFEPAQMEYLLAAAAMILSPRGNPPGSPKAIEEARQFWAAGAEEFLDEYKRETPNVAAPHIMVKVKKAKKDD